MISGSGSGGAIGADVRFVDSSGNTHLQGRWHLRQSRRTQPEGQAALRFAEYGGPGFQLSTSIQSDSDDGDSGPWDVALRYGRDLGGFEVEAIAAQWVNGDDTGMGGSASLIGAFRHELYRRLYDRRGRRRQRAVLLRKARPEARHQPCGEYGAFGRLHERPKTRTATAAATTTLLSCRRSRASVPSSMVSSGSTTPISWVRRPRTSPSRVLARASSSKRTADPAAPRGAARNDGGGRVRRPPPACLRRCA